MRKEMSILINLTFVLSYCLTVSYVESSIVVDSSFKYVPDWESLDSRPLPKWYDDAKFGIFIHWGVFSVPSFGSEWFWSNWNGKSEKYVKFMKDNYPPNFTYQDFAREFTTEFYDANEWAKMFKKSGAKYVVLTSKHHEGYTLWPSKYSFSWNSQDVGPNRDLIGELANAVRKNNMTFGLYHSLYEWFNPLYVEDKKNNFKTDLFVKQKTLPELHELIDLYKPDIIWSDGEWEATDQYWTSKEFIAWLYNESPIKDTVVVNDRWGTGILCKHGDFYTCTDRYNPGVLQLHKWENAMTIDKKSWGYRRNAMLSDYMTTDELIDEMVTTVSCGGNILMNVGPTKDGIITPIYEERLLDVGTWLEINGEAIYYSKPWSKQNDTTTAGVWYTARPDLKAVYATTLNWPEKDVLVLDYDENLFGNAVITMLGNDEEIKYEVTGDKVKISFPNKSSVNSKWAWVLKISNSSYEQNVISYS